MLFGLGVGLVQPFAIITGHGLSLYPIYRMVNIRNKGRALLSDISDNDFMTTGNDISAIKARLQEKLEEADISMRAASIAAGLGPGYVHSVLKGETEPTVTKLAKICEKNGVSLPYVMFGFEMTPETRRLLELMESDPKKRDGVLAILGD